MLDHDAIALIQTTAVKADAPKNLSTPVPSLALSEGVRIESIEHLHLFRSRFRGTYSTSTIAEFNGYTKQRQPEAVDPVSVFVNADAGSAVAFFNLGTDKSPGHADDVARLNLRHTAAYAALIGAVGKPLKQRQVAELLEDWFDIVVPVYPGDAQSAAPSLTAAIAAIRDITISAKGETNSVQGDLSASRSAFDEVEASSKKKLPAGFTFAAAPYDGFTVRTFQLRLGVLPQEKEPILTLRIVGLADVQERIGQEFESKVRDALPGVRVFRGDFKP